MNSEDKVVPALEQAICYLVSRLTILLGPDLDISRGFRFSISGDDHIYPVVLIHPFGWFRASYIKAQFCGRTGKWELHGRGEIRVDHLRSPIHDLFFESNGDNCMGIHFLREEGGCEDEFLLERYKRLIRSLQADVATYRD